MMLAITSRTDDAIRVLRPLFDDAEPDALGETLVGAAAVLARAFMLGSEPLLSLRWADPALRLSEAAGDARTVADVLITKGCSLADLGRTQEGLILVRGGTALATAGGFVREEIRGATNLSMVLMRSDPREGMELAIIGHERARDLGLRAEQAVLLMNAGECGLECGELEWFERTISQTDTDGWPDELLWYPTLSTVLLRAVRGRHDEARELLDSNAGVIARAEDAQGEVWHTETIVELARGAAESSSDLALGGQATGTINENRFAALCIGAHAAAWLRDAERLDRSVKMLRELALGESAELFIRSFEATRELIPGSDPDAVRASTAALSGIRRTSARFQLALHEIDVIHALGPDHPASATLAAEARGIFEQMGSPSFLDRLDDALRIEIQAPAEAQS